ncbi:MAG: translation initiation factor IF-2 [Clostridia bacterium]|nr:translation initiation factor IF-2 [Clostridia bacterium]
MKLTQLVKEFGVNGNELKQKDIIDLLKTVGIEKKTGGALEGEELDLFLTVLTLGNQLNNMKDYLTGKAILDSELPKPEKIVKPAPKKPEPKPEAKPASPAPKSAERPASAGTHPVGTAPARRPAPGADRPAAPAAKKARPVDQAELARRMAEFRAGQAKTVEREEDARRRLRNDAAQSTRPAANTPAAEAARQKALQAGTKAPQPQPKKEVKILKKTAPVDRFSGVDRAALSQKGQDKKKEIPQERERRRITPTGPVHTGGGEVVVAEQKRRIVDTRTSSVDLSRYDERIDATYSGAAQDNNSSRQKLKKQDTRQMGKSAKEKERLAQEKIRKMQEELARKKQLVINVPDEITVGELATRMKKTSGEVVKRLMMLGVMAGVNQVIDYDTAYLVAEELGVKVNREVVVTIEEKLFDDSEDAAENLVERSPVVCVMGHVDHGKTSLLDAIRNTNVTSGEAGGITQAIGASRVKVGDKEITFLDTPGHEAFTAMRARGAQATDIAILVVAADDGIMPQTVEAINHAKAAGIDVIVAINKMDKPQANPDAVKQELTKYGLVPEEWGGDVICVPVSAIQKTGIEQLLESVLLVAEVKELRANPNRRAKGLVIESRLDKGQGPVATVLVQNGTLHLGDIVIAGTAVGRVRSMIDDKGRRVKVAGPSVPVEINGLSEVPVAGDEFNGVEDEKMARSLAEQRREKAKQEEFNASRRANLDDLFAQISEGAKKLDIIVKADVDGSVEAVKQALVKISDEEVKVNVIHAAVGGITENDVMLAAASNAIIVGFNVRPDKAAIDSAERQKVDIRTYRIIYECIEEIQAAIKGMRAPKFREALLGHAEVRQIIHVPNVGTIAGSYVTDGKITRSAQIRIVRDGVVVFEDKIASLRRFKDDVKEVAQSYECGVGLERFNDVKEGDVLEAFTMEEIKD